MAGIVSFGAYVPLWRLSRAAITKGLSGEKAIANFDEDSLTMAVAATIDSLNGQERSSVDGLFLATTTSPYKEKQMSTLIAAAADLRRDMVTADFGNSLRAGTGALRAAQDAVKAGSAKQALVVASDCRLGAPGGVFEQTCGDGAAALIIGDKDVAVNIEASYSITNELTDVWRSDEDDFIRSWEDRFIYSAGYLDVMSETVSTLMKKCNLTPKNFAKAVFYSPDDKRCVELAKNLGFDPRSQVQNPMVEVMGCTGSAHPLMLLVAALEEAKPGDLLLLASYGNGCDAFVLRVTEQIKKIGARRGMKQHLATKKVVDDYRTYLQWRRLLTFEAAPTPPGGHISVTAQWREHSSIFPLHGKKCQSCGNIHYPPQRVCPECQAKDQYQEVRLSDKKGHVFTYSIDYLCSRLEAPRVTAIVDFEGGGRMPTVMTDKLLDDVKVGMPVEMSFRRLTTQEGIHNYFWKSIPQRA